MRKLLNTYNSGAGLEPQQILSYSQYQTNNSQLSYINIALASFGLTSVALISRTPFLTPWLRLTLYVGMGYGLYKTHKHLQNTLINANFT